MAPRRAGASWRSSARCKSRSAFSARERASAISRCSPRNGSRGGSSAGDPPAQNIGEVPEGRGAEACGGARTARYPERRGPVVPRPPSVSRRHDGHAPAQGAGGRSEEHTSELQSRLHLVCRLLLEKKKNVTYTHQL